MTLAERVATSPLRSLRLAREQFDKRLSRAVQLFTETLWKDMELGQADIDAGRLITLDEAQRRWKSN